MTDLRWSEIDLNGWEVMADDRQGERTKDEILPLAKQLMQQVESFDKQSGYAERHSHPIRLLGLGVSNQKSATPQEENQWIELELEFEPWPEK